MNKVMIKLYIPTIGMQFDVWISSRSYIKIIIKLFVDGIKELTYNEYHPSKFPDLYNKRTGVIYDINKTVKESNILNGTELMLI